MLRAVPYAFVALLAARAVAAIRLDLFGDEAFYWMCSRRLALAYVDHPFLTALLMRAGAALLGPSPIGARLFFLALGALLPAAVYGLARPLCGARDALWSAGAVLLVPVLAVAGVVAVPDVPLGLASALALAGFERATRTDDRAAWVACGLASGLALCAHVRALLIPAAFLVYLCGCAHGRAQWRRPGLWIAALLNALGALPWHAFNAAHGFSPLRYQLFERHHAAVAWGAPLADLAEQALVVTPPLYALLIGTLVWLVRRARRGDDRAALLASFAGVHLGVFLLASPWSDHSHVTLHWPAVGYLPLLAVLPGALRAFTAPVTAHGRRAFAVGAVGFAALAVVLLHLELATRIAGEREIGRAFGGWSDAEAGVRAALAGVPRLPDGRALLLADDYLLAGNLELRFPDEIAVYVLDHPKHVRLGRALQLRIWGIDEQGLREQRAGASALVVFDRDQSDHAGWWRWLRHAEGLFDAMHPLATAGARLDHPGEPRFFLFEGAGVRAAPPAVP